MAAIRAGMLNNGLGNFHGGAYYRNANYRNDNRYAQEYDKLESFSGSDSDDSSQGSEGGKNQQNYITAMLAIEKHRALMSKKRDYISSIEKKLKYIDTTIFALSLMGTILANYEAEEYYNNNRSPTKYSNTYRAIVTITTIMSIVLILIHSKLDFSITKEKREAAEEDIPEFFQSKNFKILCLEILVNAIHCPPGVNHTFQSYELNGTLILSLTEILACWTLLRIYVCLKLFRHYSK